MKGVSRVRNVFSKMFDKVGRRLIGRHDGMSFGLFPGFYNRYDLTHFPLTGETFGL